jgi:hypothetical protein
MLYVVIRPWGFMEISKKEEIKSEDKIVFQGTVEECNNLIHGKNRKLRYVGDNG